MFTRLHLLAAVLLSITATVAVTLAFTRRTAEVTQRVFVYTTVDGSTAEANDRLNALLFQGWHITHATPFAQAPGGVLLVLEHASQR